MTCARLRVCTLRALFCEIMNDDGSMSRLPDLETLASEYGLKILSIAQIVAYRRRFQVEIKLVAEARMPTKYGEFKAYAYNSPYDPGEHIALTIGEWQPGRTGADPHSQRVPDGRRIRQYALRLR